MKSDFFIKLSEQSIRCVQFGEGTQIAVAFHGFADEGAAVFAPLEKQLKRANIRLFAIDLPYHGAETWQQDSFSAADTEGVVAEIMRRENTTEILVLGFSFGARVAIHYYLQHSEMVKGLVLFAPEGFGARGMSWLKVLPSFLQNYLQRRLENDNFIHFLFKIASFLRKIHILGRFEWAFMRYHLGEKMRRARLLCFWQSLKNFPIDESQFFSTIKKNKTPFIVVFGKKDKIIPPFERKKGQKTMYERFERVAKIKVIDAEHRVIREDLDCFDFE